MGYIYMIRNKTNGKTYVGQTIRPIKERLSEHETGKSKSCRAIYNAIKFHGWGNFETDYYECPDEDLNFDEELLVNEMGTLSPDGYNLREGGGNNGKPSEDTKKKNERSGKRRQES
jgi:group I intron endonuclease